PVYFTNVILKIFRGRGRIYLGEMDCAEIVSTMGAEKYHRAYISTSTVAYK
ncbi:MAG: hypothetical protein ACI8RD_004541, partial [Bacillariaceae sp.]